MNPSIGLVGAGLDPAKTSSSACAIVLIHEQCAIEICGEAVLN